MSNTSQERQNALRDLIARLHRGESVEEVKKLFAKHFDGVSAQEIADAERALVEQGVTVEEIQKLCDVHAAFFEGSIEEIHSERDFTREEGHPTWLLKEENRAIERLFERRIDQHLVALEEGDQGAVALLRADLTLLGQIDSHYSKKENLWFPIMERYGITAPPQVMWGVDDEIRAQLKAVRAKMEALDGTDKPRLSAVQEVASELKALRMKIYDMITKEESILIPMVSEVFFSPDWRKIREGTSEIGYCLLDEDDLQEVALEVKTESTFQEGTIVLPSGTFTPELLTAVLNTLPFDMTFVDHNDEVLYFSQSPERLFARTTAILGRKVVNCHPPASMHVVEEILNDFKAGKRDNAEFYIHMQEKYIHIRYFAVRDQAGLYLGTLEVSQNIAPIQAISGEKRLLSH